MELETCPFCGGNATMYSNGSTVNADGYYISCDNCGCTLPMFDSEEEAIEVWNTRVRDK